MKELRRGFYFYTVTSKAFTKAGKRKVDTITETAQAFEAIALRKVSKESHI